MATETKGSTSVSYKYNDSGIRTSKTVNGVEHIYTLNGSQIVSESWGNVTLIYLYDENGSPLGFQYRTSSMAEGVFVNFYFEKNLFGDVVAVYNESGVKVVSYTYDAWGNHTTTRNNSVGNNMYAMHNPFRYRGYYYDPETGYYYLQSRYYNPQWGRFLNADGYINANGDLIGFNMYAYCSNNPVMYVDPTGSIAINVLSSKHQACTFNPDSVGGGGGVIVPLFYPIKTIWTVSKSLLIHLSAQVTLLGAALSSVFSDSLSTTTSMEGALADSASKKNDPDAIYIGIVIEDNIISPVTSAMTFEEAYNWAMDTSTSYEYSRDTTWGLYTPKKTDAKSMATQLALGNELTGDLQIDSNMPQGQYAHYHMPQRKFGRYKHFHIWYGLPVT